MSGEWRQAGSSIRVALLSKITMQQSLFFLRVLVVLFFGFCTIAPSFGQGTMPRLAPNYLQMPETEHTIPFVWTGDSVQGRWEPHVAMLLPVKLANCPVTFYMQFDTGTPSTVFYAHKLKAIMERYPKAIAITDTTQRLIDFRFTIGTMPVVAKEVEVMQFGSSDIDVKGKKPIIIGTVGTDFLDGRVTVIDYPKQVLLTGNELPADLKQSSASFSDFMYAGRRILLPVTIRGRRTILYFDSGSSAFELLTDKATCESMALPNVAPFRYAVSSWGRTMTANSFAAADSVVFGVQAAPLRQVTYMDGASEAQVQQMKAFGIGGMTGNKLFLNYAFVLDTKGKKFGLVKRN